MSRERGGSEEVLGQVATRCNSGVIDDGFGLEANPVIVSVALMGCWRPWNSSPRDQMKCKESYCWLYACSRRGYTAPLTVAQVVDGREKKEIGPELGGALVEIFEDRRCC